MGTDEEVARELHRQMNGSSRRHRTGSGDLTRVAARGRASLQEDSEFTDVNMSDADPQSPGHTAQASSGVSRDRGVQDSHSPAIAAVRQPEKPAEIVVKVSPDNECYAKADRLRIKAERISGIQCMYTGIKEARKVSSPALIDNRVKLAQFVNSMYSFEKIYSGKGAALDVTFVSNDRKAAAIRFPPLPTGQETCEGEELAPDGTTWTTASRNAAIVLLTQNEGNLKYMRHPAIPSAHSTATVAMA